MREKENNITGIILAGGQSSRMGKDKGVCNFKGKALVEYAIEALQDSCGEIVISTNKPDAYKKYGFPLIPDEIKEIGPMGGIYSCLKKSCNNHNLVLSCDTPFINAGMVKHIIANIDNNFDAIVPIHGDDFLEPLCAYYNINVVKQLEEHITNGDFKLMNLINSINYKRLRIDDKLGFYNVKLFSNLNTSEDLLKCM